MIVFPVFESVDIVFPLSSLLHPEMQAIRSEIPSGNAVFLMGECH